MFSPVPAKPIEVGAGNQITFWYRPPGTLKSAEHEYANEIF